MTEHIVVREKVPPLRFGVLFHVDYVEKNSLGVALREFFALFQFARF